MLEFNNIGRRQFTNVINCLNPRVIMYQLGLTEKNCCWWLTFRQPELKSSFRDKNDNDDNDNDNDNDNDSNKYFFVNRKTKGEVAMKKRKALKKIRTQR